MLNTLEPGLRYITLHGAQDLWDDYVAAHWEPTLQLAFGPCWRHEHGSEVAAMMCLTTASHPPAPTSQHRIGSEVFAAEPANPSGASPEQLLDVAANGVQSPAKVQADSTEGAGSDCHPGRQSTPPLSSKSASSEGGSTTSRGVTAALAPLHTPAPLAGNGSTVLDNAVAAPELTRLLTSLAEQHSAALGAGIVHAGVGSSVEAVMAPGPSPFDNIFERCKSYLASVTESAQRAAAYAPEAPPSPRGHVSGQVHPSSGWSVSNTTSPLQGRDPPPLVGGTDPVPPSSQQRSDSWQTMWPAQSAAAQSPIRQSLLCSNILDGTDCWGRSPLMVASAAGRLDVVRELLLAGCDASKWLPVDYRSDARPLCLL